jgi:hypothetical protein
MDLVAELRTVAAMIELGERIAFGRDTSLMRQAADAIEWLRRERNMLADRCAKTDAPF